MPCFPVHYIYLQIHDVPECDKIGIQVASWPQMAKYFCSINLLFLFTFHQSCLQHSALQARDSWGEPSVKRREGSENLDLWTHYHWDKTLQFLADTLNQSQPISEIKDAVHPHILSFCKEELWLSKLHWGHLIGHQKKQFFLLGLSNNLPRHVHSAVSLNQ